MSEITPHTAALLSVLMPVFVGLWQAYQWWAGRKDKRTEREISAEERHEQNVLKERDAVTARYDMLMRDLRSELDRTRALLDTTDDDRHRGWDKARFWHRMAWEMRHSAAGARQTAESMARVHGVDPPRWSSNLVLPPFDGAGGDDGSLPSNNSGSSNG